MLTDGKGIPLAVVVAGANRNDLKLLAATLGAVMVERSEPTEAHPQRRGLEKGYDYAVCRQEAEAAGCQHHIRTRGEERRERVEHSEARPRRWVVEVCHLWLDRFRKLLVRSEKRDHPCLGLLQFACAYLVLKRSDWY